MENLLTLSALQGICCLGESMDADRKGGKESDRLPISDVFKVEQQLWTGRCCYRRRDSPEGTKSPYLENHIFKSYRNVCSNPFISNTMVHFAVDP